MVVLIFNWSIEQKDIKRIIAELAEQNDLRNRSLDEIKVQIKRESGKIGEISQKVDNIDQNVISMKDDPVTQQKMISEVR